MKKKQIFNILLFWLFFIVGIGLIGYGLIGLFDYNIIRELLFVIGGLSAWVIASDIKIKEDK
jgi:uncharacterized membrane protein YuzA (DUF378 family)